jgi:hypothetical protein
MPERAEDHHGCSLREGRRGARIYLRSDQQFVASDLRWRQYIPDLEKLGYE